MIDEEGRLTRIDYGDRVYYDATRGIAGTTFPIGTAGMPSSVIANVLAICVARNIKTIDILGLVTFAAAMDGYCIHGHRHETVADFISLGGQTMDGAIIRKAPVTGAQGAGGFLTLEDCIIYALTDFTGIANSCDIYLSMSLLDGGYADFSKCNSVHSDLTVTVNGPARASFKECSGNCTFTAQDDGVLYIRGFKGTLVIDTMTGGTCSIYANGADITINNTCNGGTINIYGDARVTDDSAAGCTVNDYTTNTKLAGEAVVNGTESLNWNAAEQNLVLLGVAATKKKLHSLIVDISQLTAAATINIRLYMKVNGVERNLYDQPFVVGTDPDGCWIVNGTIGLHDILRVTCESDAVADDGKAIAYTYMLEEM